MRKEIFDNYAMDLERLLNEAYAITKDKKLTQSFTYNPTVVDMTTKGELRAIACEIYLISSVMRKECISPKYEFKNEKFKRI